MIDVPADMNSAVRRWFPAGVDAITAARRSSPKGVFVTGTSGSGVSSVEAELAAVVGEPFEQAADVDSAAVVVYVLDASAPIGRGVLDELMPALTSTTVAVVINKIDAHRDWREVRRTVAAVIAEYVPRAVDLSFWSTSAKLAERARATHEPDERESLYSESGIGPVAAFLGRALAQPEHAMRERKYRAAVLAGAAGARREIVDKARAVTSASVTVGLRAERARLAEIRDRERTERGALLRSRLQLTRAESIHDVGELMREFNTEARRTIASATRAELGHLPAHLGAGLRRVRQTADSRLGDRLRSIAADLHSSVDVPMELEPAADHVEPTRRGRSIEDRIMIVVGASAGVGIGRIAVSPLSVVPALDIAVIPISLILGALFAWWLVRARALVADRAHLLAWASEVAASAKSSWEQDALARVLAAESAFGQAAGDPSRSTAVSVEAELGRVEAELRAAAEHRAAVLAACDRDLAALDRGIEKFDRSERTEPRPDSVRLNN